MSFFSPGFPGRAAYGQAPCATRLRISAIITTPRGTIKAKTTSCCLLGRTRAEFPIEGRFDAGSDWTDCSSIITKRRHKVGQIQILGFYWARFLIMILAFLKLTIEGHWWWWRVLLPVWVVLGHNAVYITVAFVWLYFIDDGTMDEEEVARRDDRLYGYQLAAMLCFLIFADNVLRRIEGSGATAWFWLSSGRWELLVGFGILSVVCQLVFWSAVMRPGDR